MDLASLLADPPATHLDDRGERLAWALEPRVLAVIDAAVGPDSRTLETGAGASTALFAARGCHHTCVVPFASEEERIRAWCARRGVAGDRLDFRIGRSEDVLPTLGDEPLDLVLIDGGHGFPTPFVDFFYAGRRLRAGGLLVVDDTQLWTGRVLEGFLAEQPGWEVVERLPMNAVVVRRTEVSDRLEDWNDQPYVARRSFAGGARGAVRRAVRAADLARAEGLRSLLARVR